MHGSDIGLIVTSKNETRLYTKRKAVSRDIEIPQSIFRYILMWRTQIVRENIRSSKKYWQDWLAERDERKELGYGVSRKIRQLIEMKIDKVNTENNRLKRENERLMGIKDILKGLGLDSNSMSMYSAEDKIRARVKEIETGIPEGLLNYLDSAIMNLKHIKDKLIK